MNVYLLDTNAASALFDELNKNHEKARSFIEKYNKSRVYVSCVTWAEIRYGYKVHEKVDHSRKDKIEKTMNKYKVMKINKHTSEPYSEIRSRLFKRYGTRKKGGKIKQKVPENLIDKTTGNSLGIEENDLWIAAIAAQYNLQLVTDDRMTRIREIAKEVYSELNFWNWKTGAIF